MSTWHIITSEFPPQVGGVSDYVKVVSDRLAGRGDAVHVWAPAGLPPRAPTEGVTVHREFGTFGAADMRRVGRALDRFPRPRRLFVQWVPHGYARDSVNLTFCLWVLWRSRIGRDRVDLMVHEAYLPFRKGAMRQNAAAVAHRVMAAILVRAATKIWYSIPAWEAHWRPYYMGRSVSSSWLPLPSNVPLRPDPELVRSVRGRFATAGGLLIGHFGTFGRDVRQMVLDGLTGLPASFRTVDALLIGPGGESVRDEIVAARPDLAGRVHATGVIPAEDVSPYIAACDVMIQPYPDGVTSRRTTFMACIGLGRPTVTTLGRLSETLWADAEAALLVAPWDTNALLEAVTRLLENPAERARLGQRAESLYEERFEPRHIVDLLRQEDPSRD